MAIDANRGYFRGEHPPLKGEVKMIEKT